MQMIFPLLPQNVANAKGKKNSSMPRNLFHLISYKLLQIKWGLKCRLNSGYKHISSSGKEMSLNLLCIRTLKRRRVFDKLKK